MNVLGIDAGGTKTHCVVANQQGIVIAEGFAGPSNYQIVGAMQAEKELKSAVEECLKVGNLSLSLIHYAVFGMSGADEPVDFMVLEPMAQRIMGSIPTKVVHDSWIGMRAEIEDMVGIVSICGTGAGHSGRNRKGEQVTLRNLHYELGNMGGGEEIVSQALHYAFRSDEGTFEKTRLEEAMMKIFKVKDMEALCQKIRNDGINAEEKYQIPVTVFDTAMQGDKVAIMLLENMGYEEGLFGAGVAKRLHLQEAVFPVVLVGSLFQSGNPYLIESYMKAIRNVAPLAFPVVSNHPPVMGAIGMALDQLKEINKSQKR